MLRSVTRLASAARQSSGVTAGAATSNASSCSNSGVIGSRASVALSRPPLGLALLSSSSSQLRFMSAAPATNEQFLSGTNHAYVAAMEEAWRADPSSVHASWRAFFEAEAAGVGKGASYVSPPGIAVSIPGPAGGTASSQDVVDLLNVQRLVSAFETDGHRISNLDPLGMQHADLDASTPIQLTLEANGFTEADLTRAVPVPPGSLVDSAGGAKRPLGDIIHDLEALFTQNVGFEYAYMHNPEHVKWMRERVLARKPPKAEARKSILEGLVAAAGWESFLQQKFPSEKRFGLDGCESLIPGINRMLERGAERGVDSAVFGMAHRGRLNMLVNVLKKPRELVFNEFTSTLQPDSEGSGDVKYHLGMSNDIDMGEGRQLHVSLLANPSHLEAVNPVAMGKARAVQEYGGDSERSRVCPILIHGDAALAGQGVVYESFGFTQLPDYAVGGTVHVVINNQVGFTTDPGFSRSTPYCTDLAKMLDAPVLHVNGDDPESVAWACCVAMDWRQTFKTDAVVDIVCYRRFGHNESDQPMYTQPRLYKAIEKMPPVIETYANRLVAEGVVSQTDYDAMVSHYSSECSAAFDGAPDYEEKPSDVYSSYWKGFRKLSDDYAAKIFDTGVDTDTLHEVGIATCKAPDDFKVHPLLKRILKRRADTLESGTDLDWATAEALAFGSLLKEDVHVRLSGQDVERGTFSQRHHVLHDQENYGRKHNALAEIAASVENKVRPGYSVSNSHLSEYGVLGFELGYCQVDPMSLVCWEAQFGDFANTAQCMIDQFVASGEAKWRRQAGLVMLLPHGYEGMGPEHSSARLERFLQLCSDDESVYPEMDHFARTQIQNCNWQVAYPTTPANYFHLLRRQVYREFRKPLIVMTPKSLLRHPACKSTFDDMMPGTRFHRLIHDRDIAAGPDVKRLVFCSGKVYYDLLQEREARGIDDVAIARVEQISPFPFDLVHKHADEYPNAEIVWCQEEPRNMGAWSYVAPRITTALSKSDSHSGVAATYIGREPSASVATGDKMVHKAEQAHLVDSALAV